MDVARFWRIALHVGLHDGGTPRNEMIMSTMIEVDCTFDADGRHVLIRLPDGVHELLLRADTLTWELRDLPGARQIV